MVKVITYNCQGIKSSIHDIYELTKHYDLIFLQEIWLFTYELSILSTVNSEFESFGISAIDDSNGMAMVWYKKIFGLNRHSKNACNSKSTSLIWVTKLYS